MFQKEETVVVRSVMRRRTVVVLGTTAALAVGLSLPAVRPAAADSDHATAALTCTTNPDFGNQVAQWSSTVTDSADPQKSYRTLIVFIRHMETPARNLVRTLNV